MCYYKPMELRDQARAELASSILSASGWRHVFASHEEDHAGELSKSNCALCYAIARAYAGCIAADTVVIGTDSRPTGHAIKSICTKVLSSRGIRVLDSGVSASPQIMAYSQVKGIPFFYISASHNPVGHNGFKFGDHGAVYERETWDQLKTALYKEVDELDSDTLQGVLNSADPVVEKAIGIEDIYLGFVLDTAAKGRDKSVFCEKLKGAGISLVVDYNGSARALCREERLLERVGCKVWAINNDSIVHAIVPEGENLEPCARELEKAYAQDPSYCLGYTPDNDGDRGNLVYIDPEGKAQILQAQEVFALALLSELCSAKGKLGAVYNGPTSLRSDRICEAFGAEVFRSEVGESNANGLADLKRREGYSIPLCGEGSNGGSIVYPACVRDPLNTIFAVLDLLTSPEALAKWTGDPKAGLGKVIAALPGFTTTPSFSSQAKLKIRHPDYPRLKTAYERLLELRIGKLMDILGKWGLTSFQEIQYEGPVSRQGKLEDGPKMRTGLATGGLKIQFYDKAGKAQAFIWMRPSGTEPVFRIEADAFDKSLHDYLLQVQRSLIEEADSALEI